MARNTALPLAKTMSHWFAKLALAAAVVLSLTSTSAALYGEALPIDIKQLRHIIYVLAGVLVFLSAKLVDIKILNIVPIILYVVFFWLTLSLLWSPDIGSSLARLALVLLSTFIIASSVGIMRPDESVEVVRRVLLAFLILNVAASILVPEVGVTDYLRKSSPHQWRGLLGDKNEAGAAGALTVLLYAFGPRLRPQIGTWIIVFTAAAFVVSTQSKTAMIMLTVACLAGVVLRRWCCATNASPSYASDYKYVVIAALPVALVLLVLTVTSFANDRVFEIVSNPDVFTGRGHIWRPMLVSYTERPWLGVGYGGYWVGDSKGAYQQGQGAWLAQVAQGHNGYLDMLVQVGIPGLALSLVFAISGTIYGICRVGLRSSGIAVAPLTVIVFCLGSNLTESGLFTRDVIWSTFLVFGVTAAAKALGQGRGHKKHRRRVSLRLHEHPQRNGRG